MKFLSKAHIALVHLMLMRLFGTTLSTASSTTDLSKQDDIFDYHELAENAYERRLKATKSPSVKSTKSSDAKSTKSSDAKAGKKGKKQETDSQTALPTASTTPLPTPLPTGLPTVSTTPLPTVSPTPLPTVSPTPSPTVSPTPSPTVSTTTCEGSCESELELGTGFAYNYNDTYSGILYSYSIKEVSYFWCYCPDEYPICIELDQFENYEFVGNDLFCFKKDTSVGCDPGFGVLEAPEVVLEEVAMTECENMCSEGSFCLKEILPATSEYPEEVNYECAQYEC